MSNKSPTFLGSVGESSWETMSCVAGTVKTCHELENKNSKKLLLGSQKDSNIPVPSGVRPKVLRSFSSLFDRSSDAFKSKTACRASSSVLVWSGTFLWRSPSVASATEASFAIAIAQKQCSGMKEGKKRVEGRRLPLVVNRQKVGGNAGNCLWSLPHPCHFTTTPDITQVPRVAMFHKDLRYTINSKGCSTSRKWVKEELKELTRRAWPFVLEIERYTLNFPASAREQSRARLLLPIAHCPMAASRGRGRRWGPAG